MYQFQRNHIYNTDCIAGMSLIPDGAVDMILTDLPYGVTACPWDSLLPLEELWAQYWRVLKEDGAVVLTACQPFTTTLIQSQRRFFRYCWYWQKNQVTGFPFARFQPMRCVEDILVFYRKAPDYQPQGLVELPASKAKKLRKKAASAGEVYKGDSLLKEYTTRYTGYPRNLLSFPCQREGLHPTQKPVDLFAYLIRTYTRPGQLVLDSCMGSGTTAVAAIREGRDYIGFELDARYHRTAVERAERAQLTQRNDMCSCNQLIL